VCRKDGRDPKLAEHRIEIRFRATSPTESSDRLRDGVIEKAVTRRSLASPQRADASARLGQIDELEVERERRDDRLGVLELERVELRFEALTDLGLVAPPKVDRCQTQSLDEVVDALAGLLGDDLPKQRAEQAYLERQRVAGAC
jgi:hypothetical protein